jgi:hypothetical protein
MGTARGDSDTCADRPCFSLSNLPTFAPPTFAVTSSPNSYSGGLPGELDKYFFNRRGTRIKCGLVDRSILILAIL